MEISKMDVKDAVAALSALAHETRLAVFRILVEAGPDGVPAGSLAERLHMPPSSLTFHLQQLSHAGLVTQRRASRHIIYATDYAAMDSLMGYLTENCCAGTGGVCAPNAAACIDAATTQEAVRV